MPVPENWMSSPLLFIDSMFEKAGSIESSSVAKFFREKLNNAELFCKVTTGEADDLCMRCMAYRFTIPSLNDVPLHDLASGSLVRFRGMVQDTYDPEFFLGTYEVNGVKDGSTRLCTALYRDIISCAPSEEINFESPKNVTTDRQTVYCVPIPAENAWVKTAYAGLCSKTASSSENIHRPSGCKRSLSSSTDLPSSIGEADNGSCSMETSTSSEVSDVAKRNKTSADASVTNSAISSPVTDLNFPLPSEKGPACLVKIYGSDFEDGKLNDVIEVIGILSVDPALATFNTPAASDGDLMQTDITSGIELMESIEEHAAKNPPPSLVPRIHAIVVRKLAHNNPLLSPAISRGCSVADGNGLVNVSAVRDETLAILEQALFGDRLSAEYMLCNLVSSVYNRCDVMALGKFAVNLCGCPRERGPDFVNHLSNLISCLVTKSHLLPLSLEILNTSHFVPRKDYTANRLRSGLLQLSAGTHLLVDEMTMEPGQLQAQGVSNLAALGNVIMWQRMDYDFEYHTQMFFTDLNVLVLSEGKSLLKCDCQVPVVFDVAAHAGMEEKYHGIHTYLTSDLLQRIRTYLSHVQLLAYVVPDDVQKIIEQDFVEKRRESSNNLSVTDFHLLLTLARLVSLSCGETALTEASWRQAVAMESMRADRLKVTSS